MKYTWAVAKRSAEPFAQVVLGSRKRMLCQQMLAARPVARAPACAVRRQRAQSCQSSRLAGRVHAASESSVSTTTAPLSVWLPSRSIEETVKLGIVPDGRGQVKPYSPAAEAGIVTGQKLIAISDPVQDLKTWDMGDRPSLRFVRDTLKLRRMGQCQLVFVDFKNLGEWSPTPPGPSGSEGNGQGSTPAPASTSSMSTLDTMLSGTESDEPEEQKELTIGEKLLLQHEQQQQAAQQMSEVQKRIARRAARMEEDAARDDTPLLLGLLAAFLGPALIILGIAAGTGYLDHLYAGSLTLR